MTAISFAVSVSYAVFNGIMGIVERSIWYGALSLYYLLLTFMRGGLLIRRKTRKVQDETQNYEWRKYRVCGILLVSLPLALSCAILEMVRSEKAFVHAGLAIYAAAVYTCYKVIMAIINIVKARKYDQPKLRAARCINLADAMVSVLALQTAMLREFTSDMNVGLANALTGGFVCALTAALGIFMIIKSTRKILKEK